MKNTHTYLSLIGSGLIMMIAGCTPTTADNKDESGKSLPDTGVRQEMEQMFVYELQTQNVNEDNFLNRVESLSENDGMQPDYFSQSDDKSLNYTDEKQDIYFSQDAETGNLYFNRYIGKYLGDYRPELPDQEESNELAREFLINYKLLPQEKEQMKLLHSGGLRADTEKGDVIDKMRTITFGRILDGVPVMGAGSKIVVQIGEQGEVTGLVHKWREVNSRNRKAISQKELIPEEEARKAFTEGVYREFGKDVQVKIEEIKLSYYDGDGRYIQPAYGIRAVVVVPINEKQTNELPYMTFVAALQNPPEGLNLKAGAQEAQEMIRMQKDQEGKPNSEENTD
ncbi:MAG: hypothetical protein WBB45_13410 [Cyclobacteriaceae bacterium]